MYRDLANKALPGLDRNLNFSYNHRCFFNFFIIKKKENVNSVTNTDLFITDPRVKTDSFGKVVHK